MQTEKDAQLDRIIKAAETLAKVFDYIEERASYLYDFEFPNRMAEEKLLKKIFEIIKDSEVFNEQRTVMASLLISIINE
jgi:hypothetical protein